ncbi:phage tail protein I [Endozoicomonas acroporae]|uniref:phage tail protein I n=1 Tax=Endozoicomonas acroporae TaxID=1701104 RepID=UPI0013D72A2F|nr:phage tail protein I [Endozoicomonas acroporae]
MTSLLPPNANARERAVEASINREVKTPLRELWNPDDCPESLLPWLAWGLSVDDWNPDWPVEVKRSVVRTAIQNHTIKGTRKSVEDAVKALGSQLILREWWQENPPLPAHTFRVIMSLSYLGDDKITGSLQKAVIKAIEQNKPVRSHYQVSLGINAARALRVYGFARPYLYKRIKVNATQ